MTNYYDASNYAGEEFLSTSLPDYGSRRTWLMLSMVATATFWLVVVPILLFGPTSQSYNTVASRRILSESSESTGRQSKSKPRKHGKSTDSNTKKDASTATKPTIQASNAKQGDVQEISVFSMFVCVLCCLVSLVSLLIYRSPDNGLTTRAVFTAPLFTPSECKTLVEMAESVATRNYDAAHNTTESSKTTRRRQELLEVPGGWQKLRHDKHPTTDLNLITDPFNKEERDWIKQRLDSRLAPTLSRLFGIPTNSLRADDIFIVRYDGDRQAHLETHTDSGDITFQALLSDGFVGGGTRFWNSDTDKPFAVVRPKVGQMGIFPGLLPHEGLNVQEGRRYVLIGFLRVDRIDPFTKKSHGVSWFASWGSLNWAARKFEEGYKSAQRNMDWGIKKWTNHPHIRGLFLSLQQELREWGTSTSRHHSTIFVRDTETSKFINALDSAYIASGSHELSSKAAWFDGQQINLDFDGSLNSYWQSRADHSELFDALS